MRIRCWLGVATYFGDIQIFGVLTLISPGPVAGGRWPIAGGGQGRISRGRESCGLYLYLREHREGQVPRASADEAGVRGWQQTSYAYISRVEDLLPNSWGLCDLL